MTLDWSVVWQYRGALAAGTATTFLLTIATMAIALPCGIVVAGLRLYGAAVWDDLPHQTAVCFLPLALLFLWRVRKTPPA